MALVRNGSNLFQNPGSYSGAVKFRNGNTIKGGWRNRFVGGFSEVFGALPSGHLAPSSFVLPQKNGAISSTTLAPLSISPSASLTPAYNLVSSSTLTITVINAQLDQIVSAAGSGSLVLSVTSASLAAAAGASASATINITVSDALLGAIFSVNAASSMLINPDVTITAIGHMEAEAGGPTPLSPEGLAQAVWSAILADYSSIVGSTGEALSNSSSSGNPWDALLVDNNDSGTFGQRLQKLLTTSKFIGLK